MKKQMIFLSLTTLLMILLSSTVSATTVNNTTLTGISVSPATLNLTVNATHNFTATAIPAGATLGNVTWSVTNPTVGSINATTGVFRALAAGTTNVTASYGGFTGNATVTVTASPFAEGNGSATNPFHIMDWHHLNNVRHHMTSHFILMNNLDSTTAGYTELASSTANGGAGWLPIGSTFATPFTGNFNGQGFEIRNLFINRPAEFNVGLFGVVGTGRVVRNVRVVNVNVRGNWRVGGLVGWNLGTVTHSYASSSVTGRDGVGGLVGWNLGTVTNSSASSSVTASFDSVGGLVGYNRGTVTHSYASGSVTGRSEVGGLLGNNWDGTVTHSSASSSVTGTWQYVGGLVGVSSAIVTNSYATGSVTGREMVGGLVGWNRLNVTNSYSTGRVTGTGRVGGLVGLNTGFVTNSFWDAQTSGRGTSDGGIGRTTEQMRDITTFTGAGWNIITVAAPDARNTAYTWNIVNGMTYPFLSWHPTKYKPPANFAVILPPPPVLTGISVSPPTVTLTVGETQQFNATATPAGAAMPGLNWTSSNTTVGTIHNVTGVFTALAPGTTTITARSGAITGTATVTVPPVYRLVTYTYTVRVPVTRWVRRWFRVRPQWMVIRGRRIRVRWRSRWVRVRRYTTVRRTGQRWERTATITTPMYPVVGHMPEEKGWWRPVKG